MYVCDLKVLKEKKEGGKRGEGEVEGGEGREERDLHSHT